MYSRFNSAFNKIIQIFFTDATESQTSERMKSNIMKCNRIIVALLQGRQTEGFWEQSVEEDIWT